MLRIQIIYQDTLLIGILQKYDLKEKILFRNLSLYFQSNSRQGTNGKPTVKRSESAPEDGKKDVKPPATTPTETETQQ